MFQSCYAQYFLTLDLIISLVKSANTTSMWNESIVEEKHLLRYENKVNENQVLSCCEALRYM